MEPSNYPARDAVLWRYELICELLHASSTGVTLAERLKKTCERTPHSRPANPGRSLPLRLLRK
ncbi:MAG: hypothetical protein M3Y08_11920, partial [Fibrobacterota bacterium]|nr:hypothetical protein [Fibrobacterota bacterium]